MTNHSTALVQELWNHCNILRDDCLSYGDYVEQLAESADSEQSVKDDVTAKSNIAGAINCMVLKLMGYAGHVQRSTFEDKYVVI